MRTISLNGIEFERLASEILGDGHALIFRARGNSMHPFIQEGDVLEIQRVGSGDIRRVDVLLCVLQEGKIIAHRVIRILHVDAQPQFLIKADARFTPDGIFLFDQVLGRVVTIQRKGRNIDIGSPHYRILFMMRIEMIKLRNRAKSIFIALRNKFGALYYSVIG